MDIIESARRISELQKEYQANLQRQLAIQDELGRLYEEIKELQAPFVGGRQRKKRIFPIRKGVPRTNETRILISSGRIALEAAKEGRPIETARRDATEAARRVATKLGMELSAQILELIDRQISMRYESAQPGNPER